MAEGDVDCSAFEVFTMVLLVIHDEPLFLYWGLPCQYFVCLTGIIWAEERYQADEGVLVIHQDKDKVTVMPPSEGYPVRCHICR